MPKYKTLAEYFEETGKTQESLADAIGVTPAYISFITAGKRQPTLPVALAIAEETGIPLSSLIVEERSA